MLALAFAGRASAATVVSFVTIGNGDTLVITNPQGSAVAGQIRLVPDPGTSALPSVPFSIPAQGNQSFPNVLATFGPITSPAILAVESSDTVRLSSIPLHVAYAERPVTVPVRFNPNAPSTGILILGILNGVVRVNIFEHPTSGTPLSTRIISSLGEQVTRLRYTDLLPVGMAINDGIAVVTPLSGQAIGVSVNAPTRRHAAGVGPTPQPVLSITGSPACEFATGIRASVPLVTGATYRWTLFNATAQSVADHSIDLVLGRAGYSTLILDTAVPPSASTAVESNIRIDGKPVYAGSTATSVTLGEDATIDWVLTAGLPTSQTLSGTDLATVNLDPSATRYSYRPTTSGPKTYALNAINACGTGSVAGDYVISDACSTPHIDSITNSGAVCAGSPAQLTWATTGSGTVRIDHGVGTVSDSGSMAVSPSATTTYTITKTASCGSVSATTTVTIGSAPVITSFAGPAAVGPGLSGMISFAYTNGTSYAFTSSLSNGFTPSGGDSTTGGSVVYTRDVAAGPDTITLTVTGPCGVATRTLTIQDCAFADATMTAPASVCPLSTGNTASVPDAGLGWTYAWEVTNGTLTGGANSRAITFTAGSSGFVQVRVRLQSSGSCYENSEKAINISPAPDISSFTIDQAVVCPGAGSTMRFTIANAISWSVRGSLENGNTPSDGTGSGSFASAYGADNMAGDDVVTLTATNACGTATRTLNVKVPAPPVITGFTAPATVAPGAGATITFSYTNGSSYTLTSSLGNTFSPSGGNSTTGGSVIYNRDVAAGPDTIMLTVTTTVGPCHLADAQQRVIH